MVNFILRILDLVIGNLQLTNIMKAAAITTATVLVTCPGASAQTRWDAPRIITSNCSGCHGIDGNTETSYFPRLAGLNAYYAGQRLAEFRAAPEPPVDQLFSRMMRPHAAQPSAGNEEASINMVGIAHAMTGKETKISADWYAMQKPSPGRSSDPALMKLGEGIFLHGLPAQGLPPCQTCHGLQGQGNVKVPRIAGQNVDYLLRELAKFKVGDRKHAKEMTMVASHVDAEQFRALALYLQSQ